MEALPEALYTPAQVGELDRIAMEEHGLGDGRLMARAGETAFRLLHRRWPGAERVVVLCGGGNNGGDGYVVARLAHDAGYDVRVIALSDPDALRGDAREAMLACRRELAVAPALEAFDASALDGAEVIVDALLGTGLDRPVAGRYADAIDAVNAGAGAVLAIDVPSGLSGDTGARMGTAVRAALTVTFIGLKRGLLTGVAADHVGELVFADLAVPADVHVRVAPVARRITAERVRACLTPRPRGAHKGQNGHVLVAGGDRGMGGAVALAAGAAVHVGAGLVSALTRAEHVSAVLARQPEVMCRGIDATVDSDDVPPRAGVLALGPGLGQAEWGRALYDRLSDFAGPTVVDADGLNLLAEAPGANARRVITPHPGEAARLLGATTAEVQQDRFAALARLVERYGGTVVLKGSGTLVGDGEAVLVNDTGNPGMASGGMGDVLTGVIAGLLAQGLAPLDAAAVGVWLHGSAADVAAQDGERGLPASMLLAPLRRLANP